MTTNIAAEGGKAIPTVIADFLELIMSDGVASDQTITIDGTSFVIPAHIDIPGAMVLLKQFKKTFKTKMASRSFLATCFMSQSDAKKFISKHTKTTDQAFKKAIEDHVGEEITYSTIIDSILDEVQKRKIIPSMMISTVRLALD